jgi:hypothetical protein
MSEKNHASSPGSFPDQGVTGFELIRESFGDWNGYDGAYVGTIEDPVVTFNRYNLQPKPNRKDFVIKFRDQIYG